MLLGMEWYWWLLIIVLIGIFIPLKIQFMKWWSKWHQEQKRNANGKWGDEE